MGPTPFYGARAEKTSQKADFAVKQTNICRLSGDIIIITDDLGRHITQVTDDNREKAFLYQRLSVLIQRYNAVAILGTFAHTTPEDEI